MSYGPCHSQQIYSESPKCHNVHSNMCSNDIESNVSKSVTNNNNKFHIIHVFQLHNIELNLWHHFIWNFQDG